MRLPVLGTHQKPLSSWCSPSGNATEGGASDNPCSLEKSESIVPTLLIWDWKTFFEFLLSNLPPVTLARVFPL